MPRSCANRLLLSPIFRWFRHISEASNAYKQRQGDRGRGNASGGRSGLVNRAGSDADVQNGLLGSSSVVGMAAEDASGNRPTGRSHSFHESSTSGGVRGEAGNDEGTLAQKTGAYSTQIWEFRTIVIDNRIEYLKLVGTTV